MTAKYTEATTPSTIASTELNSLADDAAAVGSILSNDASTERNVLANFAISIATQGGARDAGENLSPIIVPEVGSSVYGDIATLQTATNYIARYADGTPVSFGLDAATTARVLTAAGVQIPNGNYKVGLLNETGQALAASGNTITKSGDYGFDDV